MKRINFKSIDSVLSVFILAFEFLDNGCMNAVQENLNLKNPITKNYPFYVLVETSGSNADHDTEVS